MNLECDERNCCRRLHSSFTLSKGLSLSGITFSFLESYASSVRPFLHIALLYLYECLVNPDLSSKQDAVLYSIENRNSFLSQYFVVETALLLTLEVRLKLEYPKRSSRKHTHSKTGSFLLSNMVLVITVNLLPLQFLSIPLPGYIKEGEVRLPFPLPYHALSCLLLLQHSLYEAKVFSCSIFHALPVSYRVFILFLKPVIPCFVICLHLLDFQQSEIF